MQYNAMILLIVSFALSHCVIYRVTQVQSDEYGVESEVTVLCPAPLSSYIKEDQYVPPVLAKWLRPHQREGVQFMYQCVMNMKSFKGNGCILAGKISC